VKRANPHKSHKSQAGRWQTV